jgi:hypothetical protein
VQHRSQRATSAHLPRSCSQHLLECPHWASLRAPEVAPAMAQNRGQGTAPAPGVISGGCDLPSPGDWDSGNPAFALSRGSRDAQPRTPEHGRRFNGMLWSPSPFRSR